MDFLLFFFVKIGFINSVYRHSVHLNFKMNKFDGDIGKIIIIFKYDEFNSN